MTYTKNTASPHSGTTSAASQLATSPHLDLRPPQPLHQAHALVHEPRLLLHLVQDSLTTILGVSSVTARVIVAEIGDDMTRFPTAGNLISWAGLCPRLDESAGKRRSNCTRHGAPWLKTVLVQAARAAANKRDSYPRAQYLRLKARRGPNKAALAVAASLLTAAYHMLKYGAEYHDLGPNHFERDKHVQAHRLLRRLKSLGVEVTIKDAA